MNTLNTIDDLGSQPRSRFATLLIISGVILVLDRLSKWWIVRHFSLGESRSFGRFFSFTFVENTGTAFGLLQNNNKALLFLGIIILGSMLYGARGFYERGGLVALVGVSFVLGGALGNLLDRYRHGHVIDFLDFHVWPVFNIADSAITTGTVILMLGLVLKNRAKELPR